MSARDCAAFRAVAPELALGIADGDERAAALAHLASCATCRRELEDFTATVDDVLVSAPAAEPSSGFEIRALAAFEELDRTVTGGDAEDRVRPPVSLADRRSPAVAGGGRSVRRWLALAAVVAALAAGAAGIVAWQQRDGGSAGSEVAAGGVGVLRTAKGSAVGSVRVERPGYRDGRTAGSELVVSVEAGAPTGTYRVHCDYDAGRPYDAGTLTVGADGVSRWSTEVTVPTYDLRRVRLVSTTGDQNLEAQIPA